MSRPPISREFAERFADEWIAAWNARDLPRVLSRYEDDFEMASPLVVEVAGEPRGRASDAGCGSPRRAGPQP